MGEVSILRIRCRQVGKTIIPESWMLRCAVFICSIPLPHYFCQCLYSYEVQSYDFGKGLIEGIICSPNTIHLSVWTTRGQACLANSSRLPINLLNSHRFYMCLLGKRHLEPESLSAMASRIRPWYVYVLLFVCVCVCFFLYMSV